MSIWPSHRTRSILPTLATWAGQMRECTAPPAGSTHDANRHWFPSADLMYFANESGTTWGALLDTNRYGQCDQRAVERDGLDPAGRRQQGDEEGCQVSSITSTSSFAPSTAARTWPCPRAAPLPRCSTTRWCTAPNLSSTCWRSGSRPCEDAACVASSAAGVLREHISRFIIPSRFLISRCSLRYLVGSWVISQFCVSDYKVKWEFIITIPDSSFTLRALACVERAR